MMMQILGVNNTTTNLTEWSNLSQMESGIMGLMNTYIAGGELYVLGIVVLLLFMLLAMKAHLPADATAAVFIPLMATLSLYNVFPMLITLLMWILAGFIVGMAIVRVYE